MTTIKTRNEARREAADKLNARRGTAFGRFTADRDWAAEERQDIIQQDLGLRRILRCPVQDWYYEGEAL